MNGLHSWHIFGIEFICLYYVVYVTLCKQTVCELSDVPECTCRGFLNPSRFSQKQIHIKMGKVVFSGSGVNYFFFCVSLNLP